MPAITVLRILKGAAKAMYYLHQRGQYRLDLKEDNIVLGCTCHHPNKFQVCKRPPRDPGHVLIAKLADFGTHVTSATGRQVGTPGYKSLEAVQGNAESALWMLDVTAFGNMMENAHKCTTAVPDGVSKRISSLIKDCVAVTSMVRPYSENICRQLSEMVRDVGAPVSMSLPLLLRDR